MGFQVYPEKNAEKKDHNGGMVCIDVTDFYKNTNKCQSHKILTNINEDRFIFS